MGITYKKAEPSSQVSCRVKDSMRTEMEKIGKPGRICSALVRDFFKIKKHESTISKAGEVLLSDGSSVYFVNTNDGVLMNIKQGGQAIVLQMNEEIASHIISKLSNVLNVKS